MKKYILSGLIVFFSSVVLVSVLYAEIIYDNGAPNQLSSNEMTQAVQTQDFMLPTAQIINEVKFWAVDWCLSDNIGYNGEITYFIYDDNAGKPYNVLVSGTFVGDPAASKSVTIASGYVNALEYMFDFTIPDFYAVANTTYHISPGKPQTSMELLQECI